MSTAWRFAHRNRSRWIYCNYLLVLFLIVCLIVNQKLRSGGLQFETEGHNRMMVDRIRSISILNEKYKFNLVRRIMVDDRPSWIYRYQISYLFNFYWLQAGGYKWHLPQMMDLKYFSKDRPMHPHNRSDTFDYRSHHPEYGVIIDTAPDPFQPLFSLVPQTGSSLHETCLRLEISNRWYPCYELRSSDIFKPLITYGLYNVLIGRSIITETNSL